MGVLLDASVLIAGSVGNGNGPSATVVSLVMLGGLEAITVDNALWETQSHLLAEFNARRLKISHAETKRALEQLRGAPTLTVHPWINPPLTLLPDNRKDAYLFAAIELYQPEAMLTLDVGLWGHYLGTQIMSPRLFLYALDSANP